jgi:hypothetical protein
VARSDARRRDADAAARDVAEAERTAMLQGAVAYYDLLLASAAHDVATALLRDAEGFLAIARARAEAEVGSGGDAADGEASAAEARARALEERVAGEVAAAASRIRTARMTIDEASVHDVTLVGRDYCPGCALKKAEGAAAQCSKYEHRHAFEVESAVNSEGATLTSWHGRTLHFLDSTQAAALVSGVRKSALRSRGP